MTTTKTTRGGLREGSGRMARSEPPAHIHLKVEPSEKAAFVWAAQKSPHKTLSRWLVAAAKDALAAR